MAPPSDKSRGIAFILAMVLGVFGAHRFYVGKNGTGILMICTLGGIGIWYLYDVIMVASGQFTDAEGRRLVRWDPEDVSPHALEGDLTQEEL
jgi:TM2 domain-containing membrane protein YozV